MSEGNTIAARIVPPVTALVVEPKLADGLFIVGALSMAGYRVTTADFPQAKALLSFSPPHLLVVDVCQGEYNGLQLVIRGRAARLRLAAVVTCHYEDVVLRRDTETLGGTYVVKPVTREELLAAAARTVWRGLGGGDRSLPVRPPFERRHGDRRQQHAIAAAAERRQADRRRAVAMA